MKNDWYVVIAFPAKGEEATRQFKQNCRNVNEAIDLTRIEMKSLGYNPDNARIVHAWEDGYC
jgi:hypothetical protein